MKISQPSQRKVSDNSKYHYKADNGIAQLLSSLDVHKAPGPDNIGPLMLKELYDITALF